MSITGSSKTPIFTLTVGTKGTFTDDSKTDVAAQVNSEIAAAPAGDSIVIDFEPGTYGASESIKLPSNSSVVGDNSTLVYVQSPGSQENFGLIVNASSYSYDNQIYADNGSGTVQPLPINWGNPRVMTGSGDVVDTNISVQGMTFDLSNTHMFGTWFINAENVDVQNNTYIGGTDGNAFVDVINGLVAQNIAVGQNNGAYDNWDGPTNISIDNNTSYMSGTSNSGWSVLINSTPSGNPNNPGNAVNDSVVGNQFASGYEDSLAINANPLMSYGPTSESHITIQDNIDSMLGVNWQSEVGSSGPLSNIVVEQNIISGLVYTSGATGYMAAIGILWNGIAGQEPAESEVAGNLIAGASSESGQAPIQNDGNSPTTTDNAIIGANNATAATTSGYGFNGTMTVDGSIGTYNGQVDGTGVIPSLVLNAPGAFLAAQGVAEAVPSISIQDKNAGDAVSVTLMAHFGSLSVARHDIGVTKISLDGETGLIIKGSVKKVDEDLAALTFTSNPNGWDDSIGITVTNSSGGSVVSFIPVTVQTSTTTYDVPITLSSAYLSELGLGTMTNFGTLDGANLTGDAVIAATGDNTILLGNSISLAFLGTGHNVVEGGSDDEYITTGAGRADITLGLGGDVTIAGGTGTLFVSAATGNNLIEAGSGVDTILTGVGSNTITGNIGILNVVGGSGSLVIETLPLDGGTLNAQLGSGNSTIFALSGDTVIKTKTMTSNLIDTGIGNTSVQSGGRDLIYLAAGNVSINVLPGAQDTIVGQTFGSASITIAGTDSLILNGEFSSTDIIKFVGGNHLLKIEDSYTLNPNTGSTPGGQLVLKGMKVGDTIQLDGFIAISETFKPNVGLILTDQVGHQITLGIQGTFTSRQFTLTKNSNGTSIRITTPITVPGGRSSDVMGSAADGPVMPGVTVRSSISVSGHVNGIYSDMTRLTADDATINSFTTKDLTPLSNHRTGIISVHDKAQFLGANGADTISALKGSNTKSFFNLDEKSIHFVNTSTRAATMSSVVAPLIGGSATVSGAANNDYFTQGSNATHCGILTDVKLSTNMITINPFCTDRGVSVATISADGNSSSGSIICLNDNTKITLYGIKGTS